MRFFNFTCILMSLTLLVSLSGCASLLNSLDFSGRPQYEQASKNKDLVALRKLCENKDNSVRKRWQFKACDAKAEISAALFVAQARDCSKLESTWETYRGDMLHRTPGYSDPHFADNYVIAAVRFYQCGQKDYVWHNFLQDKWNSSRQTMMGLVVKGLEGKGIKLADDHVARLRKGQVGPELSKQNAARYLLKHFVRTRAFNHCAIYTPYVSKAHFSVFWEFADYWARAGCRGVGDVVAGFLNHENDKTRLIACRALAKVGEKKHINKMNRVAKSDSVYKVKRGVRIYYLRDACKAAIAQVNRR